MGDLPKTSAPQLPLPIFRVSSGGNRYMLYDIETITWLRREHHILGVLVGTLAQIPQQNVFLGLPLELMPEEARLLVEKDIAYLVSDTCRHSSLLKTSHDRDRQAYLAMARLSGQEASHAAMLKRNAAKDYALQRLAKPSSAKSQLASPTASRSQEFIEPSESLFEQESQTDSPKKRAKAGSVTAPWPVTPTTSALLLPNASGQADELLPKSRDSSYALFKHLHNAGYCLSPGLRFGCDFTAYPGDPLRYHSHFLAVSADWDEEIDMLDLVGGGRLGTAVKKGYLFGGQQPLEDGEAPVRTFCLEWGGM